ncbi:MAG: ABC transporter ATP-binding protein [Planctomycetes bacterium]|nr:ABC transporter ATP-binding protein [Planctomycetota bacterium]
MSTAALKIVNYSYHYPDGTVALENISLTIRHGERVVIIGPNGAGKSSLLLGMAGFARGEGQIWVDGVEVGKKTLKTIRRVIGCCLENPDDQLFMPTLRDDVGFGPLNMGLSAEQIQERVDQALSAVGLLAQADRPPHHLSAGQKRVAALATVLSMDPKILTFDEPDGSLDPRQRNGLIELLTGLEQTLIIATCNMKFAYAIGDRVILIDGGQIVADGTPDGVMLDPMLMVEHGLELPS